MTSRSDGKAEIRQFRRSGTYWVGVWFGRVFCGIFAAFTTLILLVALGVLSDAAVDQWVPVAVSAVILLMLTWIPFAIVFNLKLAAYVGRSLGADHPVLLFQFFRTFLRDLVSFRSGVRSDHVGTSDAEASGPSE